MFWKRKKVKKLNTLLDQAVKLGNFEDISQKCNDPEVLALLEKGGQIAKSAYPSNNLEPEEFKNQLFDRLLWAKKEKDMETSKPTAQKEPEQLTWQNFDRLFKLPHLAPVMASFLLLILVSVGGYMIYQNLGGRPLIDTVSAGQAYVPVSLPIKIDFSQDATLDNIKTYFSINPKVEGNLTYDGKILTMEHEKNLLYDTLYTIKVAKGLPLNNGATLQEDFSLTFSTRPRAEIRNLNIWSGQFKAYTLNYYDQEYEVNLDSYYNGKHNFKIYKSTEAKYLEAAYEPQNYYRDQDQTSDWSAKRFSTGELVDEQSFEIEHNLFTLKPKINNLGVYYVTVEVNNEGESITSQFFLVVSQNAVNVSRLGNKLVTWVVDQRTGKSISGAEVKGFGVKADEVMFTDKTNSLGLLEKEFDFKEGSKQPNLLVTKLGDDLAINILRNGWMYDIYSMDYQQKKTAYTAYLFTDRPIYHPDDKINYKLILREEQNHVLRPVQKEVTISVKAMDYGQASNTIYEKKLTTNANGTLADVVSLSKELKSGDYQIIAEADGQILKNIYISVEFYQKPDFEVNVAVDKAEYIKGETIKASVNSNYFFGEPLKGSKVTWQAYGYDGNFIVEEQSATLDNQGKLSLDIPTENLSFPDWWYGDYYGTFGLPVTVSVSVTDISGKTSAQTKTFNVYKNEYQTVMTKPTNYWNLAGKTNHDFVINLTGNIDKKPVYNLDAKLELIRLTWDKKNHENIEEKIKTWELKTDPVGDLEFSYNFDQQGNYQLVLRSKDSLDNEVVEIFYLYVSDASGSRAYENPQDYIDKIIINTDKKVYKIGETATLTLNLPRPEGDLLWIVNKYDIRSIKTEAVTNDQTEIKINITEDLAPGFYFYTTMLQDDFFANNYIYVEVEGKKLKVQITPSQQIAGPADNMELTVKTTDEDGQPVSAETSVSVVDKAIFALKSDITGNIYDTFYAKVPYLLVNSDSLQAIQPFGGAEQGGCFTAGTKILMADASLKNIEDIKVGDQILTKADETSAELVLDKVVKTFSHTVDEYLIINDFLQITPVHRVLVNGQWQEIGAAKVGDWLLDKNNNRVLITSIVKVNKRVKVYNFTTEKYHTYIADGIYVHNDKGATATRSNFVDTAYWNAFVTTGSNGTAKVNFKLPDNLTTWVVMSKGISKDSRVGQATAEFTTSKYLIIRPVVPQFFRNGDTIKLVAAVHNNLGRTGKFKFNLKLDNGEILSGPQNEIEIINNSINNAVWEIKVGSASKLKLTYEVKESQGNARDAVELTLPVYPRLSQVRKNSGGSGAGSVNFSFEPQTDSKYSTASLTINSSVLASLPEVINSLSGYPYGCVEQTMSRHLPNVLVYKEKSWLKITPKSDLEASLAEGFDRLAKFQHEDGGFGWWENDENNVYMSGYVLEGLLEAKNAGLLAGREAMYNRLLDYLKNNIGNFNDEEKIYITYVLSKSEPGSNSDWTQKYAKEFLAGDKNYDIVSQGYLVMALANNKQTNDAKLVLEKIKSQLQTDHWETAQSDDWHGPIRDKYIATGVNLLALIRLEPQSEYIPNIIQWLMSNRNGYDGLWGSTRQSAQILYALIAYLKDSDEFTPNYTYEVYLNGKQIKIDTVSTQKYSQKIDLTGLNFQGTNNLEIKQTGSGKLYYSLDVSSFVPGENVGNTDHGIKLTREYLDLKDKPKTTFSVGDIVKIRLKVEGSTKLQYMILEDFLPAGFEPINKSLENSDGKGKINFGDEYYYFDWYDNIDYRDQKVNIFNSDFWSSNATYEYFARVSYKGTFSAPSPHAELMYSPEVYGNDKAQVIIVK